MATKQQATTAARNGKASTKAIAKAKANTKAAIEALIAAKPTKAARKPQKQSEAAKAQKPSTKAAKPQKANQLASDGLNPYRVGGGYWASVQALRELGIGKMHSFDNIIAAVKRVMRSAKTWAAFEAKEARNDNAKDTDGRILQNVSVIARVDYGKKLRDNGHEVRYNGREKEAGLIRLK